MESSKDQFIANISSELRTPLTLMMAPLESMLMGEHGPLSKEQQALLEIVHNHSVKLLQMISSLLDHSNLQSSKIEVRRQAVDVVALTTSIITDFAPLCNSKNVAVELNQECSHKIVNLDRYLYERIVFNLLSNAIKFSKVNDTIYVGIKNDQDRLLLTVKDKGMGIDDPEDKKLFQEFYQLGSTASRCFEGLGLGLSLVKHFARLMEGDVLVKSEPGKGSTFIVDLLAPALPNMPPAELPLPESQSEPKSEPQSKSKIIAAAGATQEVPVLITAQAGKSTLPKVLIAESNADLAAYVTNLLGGLCQSKTALTGENALELLYQWHPDLVLASVALPKCDGLSLCREIKSRSETSIIPVILLTAVTQREDMLLGWEAGADEYLFKPFHPAEMVTRVRSLLRGVQQRKRAQEQIERLNEALEKRVIELAHANKELKSLAAKLETARDQALESSRFKSEFLANMSHEIRTPINGVISMSDMLMRTHLSNEQKEIAGIIHDSAASLLDIINDILDFSKIEAGKLELEILDFDLRPVIEGMAELVADQARAKQLSLMTYIAPDVPRLFRGDPGRLRQVLLNLLSNAIKFTEKGEVIVRVTAEPAASDESGKSLIKISVSDTGIGMSRETVHRLFQPFTQADGSITRRYGGTGLGLSIAKLLIELLGGHIGVRSTEGHGSTFWFSVPLARAQSVTIEQEGMVRLDQAKVLVIDAAAGTAQVIYDYSRSWGIECHVVGTCAAAQESLLLESASDRPFNLAIVELTVPDIGGFAFAEMVKNDPRLRATKLIMCTSSDQEQLGQSALQSGFSAYLVKPIKQSKLFDCIALLLNKSDAGAPAKEAASLMKKTEHSPKVEMSKRGIILVAEDNPVNQKVAVLLLKELGFLAHVVGNGVEVLDAIQHAPYALILMDCQMPDMDGLQAAIAIRNLEKQSGHHIPIIAMTAHAMQGDREKCMNAGMDDYISKPVTSAKLKEVVLKWFAANAQTKAQDFSAPAPLQAGEGALSEDSKQEINWARLQESCGDSGARELLQVFIDSSNELLDKIGCAIRQEDSKALKASAHELKGACSSMGAKNMSEVARLLEELGAAQTVKSADENFSNLRREFERVSSFCKNILQSGATPEK